MTTTVSSTTIYIVSFAPANDDHVDGGFYWYPTDKRDEALVEYGRLAAGDTHIVRFVEMTVDNSYVSSPDTLTEMLDHKIYDIELFLPARYNHIPRTVQDIERIPHQCRNASLASKINSRKCMEALNNAVQKLDNPYNQDGDTGNKKDRERVKSLV